MLKTVMCTGMLGGVGAGLSFLVKLFRVPTVNSDISSNFPHLGLFVMLNVY